jgi:hypothetical protein
VARLLSDHWDSIDKLNQLLSHDKDFERFVLRHVDELMTPTQARKIREQADHRCSTGLSRLCGLIRGALSER